MKNFNLYSNVQEILDLMVSDGRSPETIYHNINSYLQGVYDVIDFCENIESMELLKDQVYKIKADLEVMLQNYTKLYGKSTRHPNAHIE